MTVVSVFLTAGTHLLKDADEDEKVYLGSV